MTYSRRAFCLLPLFSTSAQAGRVFGRRADPRLEMAVFTDLLTANLSHSRVAVYPFDALEAYSPPVPSFSHAVRDALAGVVAPRDLGHMGRFPWAGWPRHLQPRAVDAQMAEIAADGVRHQWSYAVYGRVNAYFRKSQHGLLLEVTARVVDCYRGRLLWHGAIRADWIREFREADCAALVARRFVADWTDVAR